MNTAWIGLLLLFLACGGCRSDVPINRPSTAAIQGAKEPCARTPPTIDASVEKQSFKPGEPIVVHLKLKLNDNEAYLENRDFFHCFTPELATSGGRRLTFSQSGGFYFNDHVGGSSVVRLASPYFLDEYDFPLSTLFDLTAPGIYTVYFTRNACSCPQFPEHKVQLPQFEGLMKSNQVEFKVLSR